MLLDEVRGAGGAAGGAAGGDGKELLAEGGEGFAATWTGAAPWFRLLVSFCAREADDDFPPLGATGGAFAAFGPELL